MKTLYYWENDGTRREITGRTLRECWAAAVRLLSVDGRRTLDACEMGDGRAESSLAQPHPHHPDTGARICASLYDGHDGIWDAAGRKIRF